jgi:diacylglycerol kinase family enzyme
VNPASGGGLSRRKARALDRFARATGAEVLGRETRSAAEFSALVRLAARDHEALVFGGGDGTLSAGLNALLEAVPGGPREGPALPVIGFLPLGTGNAAGYALGLRSWRASAEAVRLGAPRAADLLRLEASAPGFPRVALFASVGWDARLAALRERSGRRGLSGYVLPAVRSLLSPGDPRRERELVVDGKSAFRGRALALVAGKIGFYGAGLCVNALARADDGLVHLAVFERGRLRTLLAAGAALAGLRRDAGGRRFSGREAVLRDLGPAGAPLDFQADGETLSLPASVREVRVTVLPKAVRFLAGGPSA